MPIRLRFILVANLFFAGLGIIGFIAIRDMEHASTVFSRVASESIDQVKVSDQIRANLPDLRASELEYITTSDPHLQPAVLENIQARREAMRQVMDHFEYDQRKEYDQRNDSSVDCVSC